MWQKQAANHPTAINSDLGCSLHTLSMNLRNFNLGNQEDTCDAIQMILKFQFQLAANRPAEFNPGLALSLHVHSRLISIPQDTLAAIQEVIQLRRKLAADCSVEFNPNLILFLCVNSGFFTVPQSHSCIMREVILFQQGFPADGSVSVWLSYLDSRIAHFLQMCLYELHHQKDTSGIQQFIVS